jgi:transposase
LVTKSGRSRERRPTVRHCGIDVHARTSELCEVSSNGKVVRRERLATSQAGLRRRFEGVARMRVVLECSGSTPWVVRLLQELGHEVVVVNPRRVRLIAESTLKCDRVERRDPCPAVAARSRDAAAGVPAELRGATPANAAAAAF